LTVGIRRELLSGGKYKIIRRRLIQDYQLYLLLLPALAYIIIFHYIPMYGVQIALRDFKFSKGILGSPWVGLKYFIRFVGLYNFWPLIRNTLWLSVYSLVAGFPFPIVLALLINETRNRYFKKTVQIITYAPHFISTVVLCGMILLFLNKSTGIINNAVALLGGERKDYMMMASWFPTVYVVSGIWQNVGWGSIIYIAALSSVPSEIVESAYIDGAGRLRKIIHIDLPTIMPTIIILLILNVGRLLSVGFEKVLLLQNNVNRDTSDIISTYTYEVGLLGGQYSFSSAIGLFNSVVNFILLLSVNRLAGKFTETKLW